MVQRKLAFHTQAMRLELLKRMNMPNPVIKTEHYSKSARRKVATSKNNYKGLEIHALKGLHERIGEMVRDFFPVPSHLLDTAAGSGALSLRLREMGHEITACDYVHDNFRLADTIRFIQLDLNSEFSKKANKRFDGILAVEIIEHLENPRHVIREFFASLVPGGKLILTTPNIDSPISLAYFVRFGWFYWFSEGNYQEDGHITPVSQYSMRKFLEEAGFVDIEISSFGDCSRDIPYLRWARMRLLVDLLKILSAAKNRPQGEILVVAARKPE